MKTRLFIIALFAITLCACDQYYVPDDFPKKEFYSYAPYQEGDTVTFTNPENDTLSYLVRMVHEHYLRGEKGCKCGKETVNKEIEFQNIEKNANEEQEVVYFWLDCLDRDIVNITLGSYTLGKTYALYQVDSHQTEDVWAKSFDNTKIFKEFTDTITMSLNGKNTAQIKKGEGILWYIDANDITWTASK